MTLSFQNGLVIYAIIHRYRRDLIDFASLDPKDIAAVNNQLAFNLLECELDISPVTTGQEMAGAEIIGQLLASAVTQRKKRRSAERKLVQPPEMRACFGGNNTKPTRMKVCQGLQIIMLTRMENLGALLCEGASVMSKPPGRGTQGGFIPALRGSPGMLRPDQKSPQNN